MLSTGFFNIKSILSNILKSTDIINEYLMEVDNTDVIYFDFSKAFDTVSQFLLLVKRKNSFIYKKNRKYCKIFLTEIWKYK